MESIWAFLARARELSVAPPFDTDLILLTKLLILTLRLTTYSPDLKQLCPLNTSSLRLTAYCPNFKKLFPAVMPRAHYHPLSPLAIPARYLQSYLSLQETS